MTKTDARKLFGKYNKDLANALNKHPSLISRWPEQLTNDQTNMVMGAYYRQQEIGRFLSK